MEKKGVSSKGTGGYAGQRSIFDFSKLNMKCSHFEKLLGEPCGTVLFDYIKTNYGKKDVLVWNMNHPFMKKMEEIAAKNERLAAYFLGCELIKSDDVFEYASCREREEALLGLGKVMLDG